MTNIMKEYWWIQEIYQGMVIVQYSCLRILIQLSHYIALLKGCLVINLPSYNVLKYEYRLLIDDDDMYKSVGIEGKISALYDLYKSILMKYHPNQITELFTWIKRYSMNQLRDIGLTFIQRDGGNGDTHELITTVYCETIIGRIVQSDDICYGEESMPIINPTVRVLQTNRNRNEYRDAMRIQLNSRYGAMGGTTLRHNDGRLGTTYRVVDQEILDS